MENSQNYKVSRAGKKSEPKKRPKWFNVLCFLSCSLVLLTPITIFLFGNIIASPKFGETLFSWLIAGLFWSFPVIVLGIVFLGYRLWNVNKNLGSLVAGLPFACATLSIGYVLVHSSDHKFKSFPTEVDRKLAIAVIDGNIEQIKYLAVAGANVNSTSKELRYRSPLHVAYHENRLEAFELLLKLGANPNSMKEKAIQTNIATSILYTISSVEHKNQLEYLELLFEHGLNPNLSSHLRILSHSAPTAGLGITKIFIDNGADPNRCILCKWSPNSFGCSRIQGTMLESSIRTKNWDVSNYLIDDLGVDVRQETVDLLLKQPKETQPDTEKDKHFRKAIYQKVLGKLKAQASPLTCLE